MAVFAIWIIVWFLTAVLSISLSADDTGIGKIANTRCEANYLQKIYGTNCVYQVKQRLLITSLIVCGFVTFILCVAWKVSLNFYMFLIREEDDEDESYPGDHDEIQEMTPQEIEQKESLF